VQRRAAVQWGKLPTRSVRRHIARFRRSTGLVEAIRRQCSAGKLMKASHNSWHNQ